MKTIFEAITNQLAAEIPTLKWIDLDTGQLDFYEEKPPVAFPCALIDIDLPNCDDASASDQVCDVNITIRYGFQPMGQSNHTAPETAKSNALEFFETVDSSFDALQGFANTELSKLSRKSQTTEKRDDGLKVVRQVWESSYMASVSE